MSAPAPLTGPECDLRDFAFMPLDVRRLLTSETWIEAADDPKLAHVLICLWCESWHQVPAGSLPDKDRILARLAMCTPDEWARVREHALQGWLRCADGRLYHPVVAEKARDSWERKLAQRERTRRASEERERRQREAEARRCDEQRNDGRNDERDAKRNVHQGTGTGTGIETGTGTGTGIETGIGTGIETGIGTGTLSSQTGASPPASPPSPEDRFWSRLKDLQTKGIGRSRCTRLLELVSNDFVEANRILDGAEKARTPSSYLGGTIKNLEASPTVAPAGANPNVPAWVNERRLSGIVVEAAGNNRWRSLGETLNDSGEAVGF